MMKNKTNIYDEINEAEVKTQRRMYLLFGVFVIAILSIAFLTLQLRKEKTKVATSYEALQFQKDSIDNLNLSLEREVKKARQFEAELRTLYAKNDTAKIREEIESLSKYIVYVQYKSDKPQAIKIQKRLQEKGYNAPDGVDYEANSPKEIRYFHDEDKERAMNIQKLIQEEFKVDLTLRKLNIKARPKLIEVWL